MPEEHLELGWCSSFGSSSGDGSMVAEHHGRDRHRCPGVGQGRLRSGSVCMPGITAVIPRVRTKLTDETLASARCSPRLQPCATDH